MRPTELQQRLEAEVMEVEFDAIAPHVGRDAVFLVSRDLPLVKVALAVSLDLADDVKGWLEAGAIERLDAPATEAWSPQERFRFLIVQPFVLIQR